MDDFREETDTQSVTDCSVLDHTEADKRNSGQKRAECPSCGKMFKNARLHQTKAGCSLRTLSTSADPNRSLVFTDNILRVHARHHIRQRLIVPPL